MGKFMIFSDSSCDIPEKLAMEHNVILVPLKVSFDRVNKLAEGVDIDINEFYERLKTETLVPKTYFPTVREYVTMFKSALDKGNDVLCLCLSSNLSKGYESACNAREIMSRVYKHNKVVIFDSLTATGGQAALTLNAARLRDAGLSVDEAYKKLEVLRESSITIFTVSSLEQLARGGRMSKATAAMGKFLHINPIIHMINGHLVSREKAIGRSKAISLLKKLAVETINKKTNDYEFTVIHSRSFLEAKEIEQDLQTEYNIRWFNPMIEIGASIGSHTGASVVAINCTKRI